MNKKNLKMALVFTIIIFLITGCLNNNETNHPQLNPIDKGKNELIAEVTLYFSDDQAMYLVPEKRTVIVKDDGKHPFPAGAIVLELIKGPISDELRPTLPIEAKLLSIEIKDNVAIVNFTEELKTRHRGGSSGEIMTIMSIVNSLTELDEINKVQILIAGEIIDTLAGHLYLEEPLERDNNIINIE